MFHNQGVNQGNRIGWTTDIDSICASAVRSRTSRDSMLILRKTGANVPSPSESPVRLERTEQRGDAAGELERRICAADNTRSNVCEWRTSNHHECTSQHAVFADTVQQQFCNNVATRRRSLFCSLSAFEQ